MIVPVNYIAVLGAAVAAYVVGALWYGPVFGRAWMKLSGITRESMKDMPLTPAVAMTLGFITTLLTSYVMAVFVTLLGPINAQAALTLSFWIWIGFVMTTLAGGPLWEGKSFKLFAFNSAHSLVALSVLSLILTFWR